MRTSDRNPSPQPPLLCALGRGAPTLLTPGLDDGTILPGVTRESVLELARSRRWSLPSGGSVELRVEERGVSLAEVREAARAGRLLEAFGSGTAVVVQPVSAIAFPTDGGELETIAVAHAYDGGSVAEQILGTIQDIQYARGEETEHPWSVPVCALEG